MLDVDGIMVAITPNSYLSNKSAIKLRKYLIDNKFIKQIIDFKEKKVFPNISTYCCITIFTKSNKKTLIYNDNTINYDDVNKQDYNLFTKHIEFGDVLGEHCTISNGIATLRDNIYIHDNKLFDEYCWKTIVTSKKDKWIIFPYDDNGVLINEIEFKQTNPFTYDFLYENKDILSKRDKGNKTYGSWYAFGRTQSLKRYTGETVMYIPTFADPMSLQYNIRKHELFSSLLCIRLKSNIYTLEQIGSIIKKNIEYIKTNSSKRGGGWVNISGNTIKNIPLN